MTERDKLIKLLRAYENKSYRSPTAEELADYLIKHGVTIPVRCKDCKYRDPEDKKCDHGGLEHQGVPFAVSDDYFCADGERRPE